MMFFPIFQMHFLFYFKNIITFDTCSNSFKISRFFYFGGNSYNISGIKLLELEGNLETISLTPLFYIGGTEVVQGRCDLPDATQS